MRNKVDQNQIMPDNHATILQKQELQQEIFQSEDSFMLLEF